MSLPSIIPHHSSRVFVLKIAAMRALSFNPVAASLVGVNNDRVIAFTFALGSAMAAAGGSYNFV